ncbi:hypothetical protein JYU34_015123 [Plutella xylostella]|uniref:Uncharacterized protein n=1 Tax=Plutella xylostella TaxID=51655 RepID=A0ABQ7PPQ9_PLUXY|nr:hypothetical protein JYU34_022632 [Plutella xylostella]KAG7298186.1 hypothetical protein JYU34_018976 [Plutella xylostella]KAG7298681.1 hypothetical protein JYU34_017087 [Plutella xylostella]KAG7300791.1 hypothetical protein JYU34_015123 [Plutella xylostella]
MNIDKFGHHVHKRLRAMDSFEFTLSNKVLVQNESGDYDLRQSRLKGLQLAVAADEAVNKEYVDQNNKLFCKKHNCLTELKSIKAQIQQLQKQLGDKCSSTDVSNMIKDHIVGLRDNTRTL